MSPQKLARVALFGLRGFIVICFLFAIVQNYFSDGTITIFSYKLKQFYGHIEFRILPLLCVSFFLVPYVQRILNLPGRYYWPEILIALLTAVDAYTHVNGFYGFSFNLPFYERIWFDKVMHFTEGVILLLAFYPLLLDFARTKMSVGNYSAWAYWMTIGFTSIFFIAWEIVELVADDNLNIRLITSIHDTNEDLAFAYAGFGVAFVLIKTGTFFRKLLGWERQNTVPQLQLGV